MYFKVYYLPMKIEMLLVYVNMNASNVILDAEWNWYKASLKCMCVPRTNLFASDFITLKFF